MLVHGFAGMTFKLLCSNLVSGSPKKAWRFLLLTGSGAAGDQDLNFKKPILAATNNIGNTDNYPQKFGWKGIAQH